MEYTNMGHAEPDQIEEGGDEPRHERGCGFRVEGGIYAETQLSPFGTPLSAFLIDPPIAIDTIKMGLTGRGVQVIERMDDDGNGTDVWDVWDVVGSDSYPNVADFISEIAEFGLSRRIARTAAFNKLTAQSKMVMLHKRAVIENYREMRNAIAREAISATNSTFDLFCPKCNILHEHAIEHAIFESCLGLAFDDLDPATCSTEFSDALPPRTTIRTMPGFEYAARVRPDGFKPMYQHGIFAILPISQLTVIKSPSDPSAYDVAMDAALMASIPVLSEES